MAGVACFAAGCSAPVTGQCAGYGEGCGRFCCARHSQGRLCAECEQHRAGDDQRARAALAEREQRGQEEQARQRVLALWAATAEEISAGRRRAAQSTRGEWLSAGLLVFAVPALATALALPALRGLGDAAWYGLLALVAYWLPLALAYGRRAQLRVLSYTEGRIAEEERRRPGYGRFFVEHLARQQLTAGEQARRDVARRLRALRGRLGLS